MDRVLRLLFIDACLPIAEVSRIGQALADPAADRAALLAELERRDWRGGLAEIRSLEELRLHEQSLLWDLLPAADKERVVSLDGIAEGAPDLQVLDLSVGVQDLRPLTALEALAGLRVRGDAELDLAALLDCPSLRRVRLEGLSATAVQRDVLKVLEQRGVAVDWPANIHALAAPFSDPMLKLAVLDVLVETGLVVVPELVPIDEFRLDEGNLARVLVLPLTPDALASVECLTWAGGGYDLMHKVWPQFDGESGEFIIRSLAGLEALPNLRSFKLSPLRAVPSAEIEAVRQRGISLVESDPALNSLSVEDYDQMLRELGVVPPSAPTSGG